MKLMIISLLLTSLLLTACVKTPHVERVVNNKWSGDGVLYALPRTAITATFDISRTDFEEPICKNPSKDNLETMDLTSKDVSNDARTAYAVHSGEISARAIPDNDKVFAMHIPESSNWVNTAMTANLNGIGIIDSVEASSTSKALEIGVKTLELGFNITFSLMGAGITNKDVEQLSACDKVIQEYEDLKQAKENLYTGPGYPTKDAYEELTDVIDLAMASKQAYFLGKQTIQKDIVVCEISPSTEGDVDLFEVNVKQGFLLKDSCKLAGGTSVTAKTLTNPKKITMKIEKIDNSDLTQADFATLYQSQTIPEEPGFYYNVPVDTFVSIDGHSKAKVNRTRVVMPQMGSLGALPRIKGNSPFINVSLHPETGALKMLKITNDAADMSSLIGTVNTGVTSYFAARKALDDKDAAEKQAEEAKADELNVLTREKSILEMRLAIITITDALEQLNE